MAPLMVVSMVAVHAYASQEVKTYSFTALVFMILAADISSSVHFVILTVSHQIEATGLPWVPLFLSWKWPSVAYTLDILAWDRFSPSQCFYCTCVQGRQAGAKGADSHDCQRCRESREVARCATCEYTRPEYRHHWLRCGCSSCVPTAWHRFRAHPACAGRHRAKS
jgi:hypothetical protein